MANFNLQDYETVEQRLKRLYELHPDARVVTHNLTTEQDRQVSTWVVQAEIWLPVWTLSEEARSWFVLDRDSSPWYLKATGLAFEVDGSGMTQKTSALETCETSAIGRALANMNLSGNKRSSREEMQKVQSGVTPKPPVKAVLPDNIMEQIKALPSKDAARAFYKKMAALEVADEILRAIEVRANELK